MACMARRVCENLALIQVPLYVHISLYFVADLVRDSIEDRIIKRNTLRVKRCELSKLLKGDDVVVRQSVETVEVNDPFLCRIYGRGNGRTIDYEEVTSIPEEEQKKKDTQIKKRIPGEQQGEQKKKDTQIKKTEGFTYT